MDARGRGCGWWRPQWRRRAESGVARSTSAPHDHGLAVGGLGEVGLPVAVAFAEAYPGTVGFDVDTHKVAALRASVDFHRGHSAERIITAGVHRAASIEVAEAAKVIENTQRDLNIALMNELAIIFERLGLRTADVLAAARTKWNFLPFTPGLVGGHCIGVDPYYLTAKAEELGYYPQVILAGRRINDGLPAFLAQKTVKLLVERGVSPLGARVRVLGITFKEDVVDLRNLKVPDLVNELRAFGCTVDVCDSHADPGEARHEYGLELADPAALPSAHAVVLAAPHAAYLRDTDRHVFGALVDGGVVVDVKARLGVDARVWALERERRATARVAQRNSGVRFLCQADAPVLVSRGVFRPERTVAPGRCREGTRLREPCADSVSNRPADCLCATQSRERVSSRRSACMDICAASALADAKCFTSGTSRHEQVIDFS